jgi:SOS-response transcriptional repressor LexA
LPNSETEKRGEIANHWNSLLRQTIFCFIHHYIVEHGWAPTFKEIGEVVGIWSRGHVHYHLTYWSEQGILCVNSTPCGRSG